MEHQDDDGDEEDDDAWHFVKHGWTKRAARSLILLNSVQVRHGKHCHTITHVIIITTIIIIIITVCTRMEYLLGGTNHTWEK